jgi:aryl-alcohol dehydrogenase-like predicted oxidoreductase
MVEGAEAASAKNNLPHFISVQNEYSPLEREAETDVVPALAKHGLGLLPYAPLAGGLLSGKYKQGAPLPQGARLTVGGGSRFLTDANLAVVEKLRAYAAARGQSLLNLTFGWLAAHPWVSCVMAGATTPAQIQQNVAAVSWIPSPEEVEEINKLLPT